MHVTRPGCQSCAPTACPANIPWTIATSDAAQRALAFDPLHLVDGIEASDDPLLEVRSAAYAISRRRRQ